VGGLRAALHSPVVGPLVVIGGAIGLVIAGMLPVWGSRLSAPQYPKGLSLWIYGGRAEGDINEITGLNHYIGMQPIDVTTVPELGLWPLVIVAGGVMLPIAVFVPGWIGRLAVLGLFLLPVGIVVDIQRWLAYYGTDLDPSAALALDPFVPLAIGPTKVWNFEIWTYPGPALVLLLLITFAAVLGRRAERAAPRVRLVIGAAAVVLVVVGTALVVMPAVAPAPSDGAAAVARASPPVATADLEALVAEAEAGTTVVVPAGSYVTNLVIDKPLSLVAGGHVMLSGNGRGTVVTIDAPGTIVRGFHVTGTGGQIEDAAAIKVLADDVTVEGNTLDRFFTGIAVAGASGTRILDNTLVGAGQVLAGAGHATAPGSADGGSAPGVTPSPGTAPSIDPADPHAGHAPGAGPIGQGDGISLWNSTRVLIRGNRIARVRDGVYLNYVDDALIDSNEVADSRYAIHEMFGSEHTIFGNRLVGNLSGLVSMYTGGVLAGRNTIVDSRSAGTGFGVVLKDVGPLTLRENVIARNRIGLRAEGVGTGAAVAAVSHNRIGANLIGLSLAATNDITFSGNAFDGNVTQVQALEPGVGRHNQWFAEGYGNTWSDYAGFDLAGDGIGDVPHRASGVGQALLGAAPALEAYRTAPALRLLEGAQAAWDAAQEPVMEDPYPLTVEVAPALVATPAAHAETPWLALGVALLVGCGGLLVVAHRSRPGRAVVR
jgi:nitrous oxidase accessory protein